jgi:hypothetical protein
MVHAMLGGIIVLNLLLMILLLHGHLCFLDLVSQVSLVARLLQSKYCLADPLAHDFKPGSKGTNFPASNEMLSTRQKMLPNGVWAPSLHI